MRYMHLSPAAKESAVRLLDRRPVEVDEEGRRPGTAETGSAWHQAVTSGFGITKPLGQ
jgi:hypothetical protein